MRLRGASSTVSGPRIGSVVSPVGNSATTCSPAGTSAVANSPLATFVEDDLAVDLDVGRRHGRGVRHQHPGLARPDGLLRGRVRRHQRRAVDRRGQVQHDVLVGARRDLHRGGLIAAGPREVDAVLAGRHRVGPEHLARGHAGLDGLAVDHHVDRGTRDRLDDGDVPSRPLPTPAPGPPGRAHRHGHRRQRQCGASATPTKTLMTTPLVESRRCEDTTACGGCQGAPLGPRGRRIRRSGPHELVRRVRIDAGSRLGGRADHGGGLMRRAPIAAVALGVTALVAAACGVPMNAPDRVSGSPTTTGVAALPAVQTAPVAPSRPNIVFVLMDDFSMDLLPTMRSARLMARRGRVVRERLRRRLAVLRLAQRDVHRAVPAPDRRAHQHQQPARTGTARSAAGAASPPTATRRAPSPSGCRSRAT